MPVVYVYMWSGLSKEAKVKIAKGITKVFEDIGIPTQVVEVIIHEISKENWAIGGELASEKFRDVKPP